MNVEKKVRTRIAPSPSGYLHIGTARTSLFCYLYAKKLKGEFIVRIEDTDKSRTEKKYEDDILDGLEWLGLKYDELYRQSERTDVYVKKLQELVESDKAYISKEKAKDDDVREVEVVRLRNPNTMLTFTDTIRGEITFDTTELGDFVIARSKTDPLYHFAVVVDDALMDITHVIRGDDHISNTPRQILILEACGFERPQYTHLPMILAPDRSKMSKRKGAVAVTEYRAQGFLPSAIINYLALLGWNGGTEKEIYSMEELVQDFSLDHLQKSGAVFDIEKLKWFNKEHRKLIPKESLTRDLKAQLEGNTGILEALERSPKAVEDLLERFSTWAELKEAVATGEYDFYEKLPVLEKDMLAWKKDPNPERMKDRLHKILELIGSVDTTTFTYENVKGAVWAYAETEGKGGVLWPMRVALSGKERSPDPFILAEALGKEETITRLNEAYTLYL
ncbi:MAG: Glutamate-tRNA ligase [Parcubacteria group bacterium GW2011_GWC2_42_11]|nr:MAG: Glutamate-tRNA ligase [Parcubacteria group bacterium GW2011_GWC2_42_11]